MKKLAVLGAVFAALTFAAPAQAADMPIKGPIYKAAPAPAFNWTGFYFGGHLGYGWGDSGVGDVDGFFGGVQAGYNWQFNRNWVFGIEADISGTDINTVVGPSHIDYIGTARVRLGYTWDRVMFYGTGGLSFARGATAGVHTSDTGWALGTGLEWAFAHRWSAKVEYMYYDINAFEISTVKFGVNYRF
jgi:outer membrane immunogenic protein